MASTSVRSRPGCRLIAVVGGSGCGKSTAVEAVMAELGDDACAVSFDAYYRDHGHLTPAERAEVNYDDPASLDVELFAEHLAALRAGAAVAAPVYDFATHTRTASTVEVQPAPLVLVDGILTLAVSTVRAQLDASVFLDVPSEVRLARRLERDVRERGRTPDSVRSQFAATVEPMHAVHVGPSRAHANVVLEHPFSVSAAADAVRAVAQRLGWSPDGVR